MVPSRPIGTRVIASTPPASTTSCWPLQIAMAAKLKACWLDPHWRLIDVPVTSTGNPAMSAAVRAML